MALSSGSRCGDLASLDTRYRIKLGQGTRFLLQKHKKNRRSSIYPGKIDIPSNPENLKLCPCACLSVYLHRTKDMRRNKEDPVFRGLIQPHNGLTPATISKWITACIKACYPSTKQAVMGHSTRGHAATKADKQEVTTKQIMEAAEWRSNSTFRNYYKAPGINPSFGRNVLHID